MNNKASIKLNIKRMLAYPLDENNPSQYDKYKCYHCEEDYLSQGDKVSETMFCPIHKDYKVCFDCNNSFSQNHLQIDAYTDELYCENCYPYQCSYCGEVIKKISDDTFQNNKRFCSTDCFSRHWHEYQH